MATARPERLHEGIKEVCWIALTLAAILGAFLFSFAARADVAVEMQVRRVLTQRDTADIYSPKSVRFSADGSKFYVNSLEGGKTVVFSWPDLRRLTTIKHVFTARDASLFNGETTAFNYPYYAPAPTGDANQFMGKPVESELSHGGRWLWVPYYRRSYDEFAQNPSAIAIIDTTNDKIVRVMPTGPIPKYVVASPDGNYVAVIHWGDNTVGLIDTHTGHPQDFKYVAHMTVESKLDLSRMANENRDTNSGFCLRGSVFTPDSQYLLVGRMCGGGIAGFHIPTRSYLGSLMNVPLTPRHLVVDPKGTHLMVTSGVSGTVSKGRLVDVIKVLESAKGKRTNADPHWQKRGIGKDGRTLDITPDGRVLFTAFHDPSEVAALDAETLQLLGKIKIPDFAVGLAIAPDMSGIVLTSQGKSKGGVHQGGNAVTIVAVRMNGDASSVAIPIR